MLEARLMREEKLLILVPVDELEETDFKRLNLLVDPYLEKNGELDGILIYADDFSGWDDFSAMMSHIRFVNSHHHKVKRIAAVADGAFQTVLPKVVDYFVDADVRHYDFEERDEAIMWLKTGIEH